MKRRQFGGYPVFLVLLVALFRPGGDWILLRIVKARVVEHTFAMHFKIADIGVPVADSAPRSGPSMVVHTCQSECRGIERGGRLSVRPESLSVEVQFSIELSRPPRLDRLLHLGFGNLQHLGERAQVRRESDDRANVQVALGQPSSLAPMPGA
ncbi:hypothetical protein AJ87_35560 [Rhizobium yanglingense]|nr:hypothetical protein AJ87_35560 [Rhizobium yanglingense]